MVKKKILLIDDNKDITIQIGKFLKIKGYDCVEANSGQNGLELIFNLKFDYVLLDLSMPEFSGFDVITQLENKNLLKTITLIVLTASKIDIETRDELRNKNIKILEKPIELKELMILLNDNF